MKKIVAGILAAVIGVSVAASGAVKAGNRQEASAGWNNGSICIEGVKKLHSGSGTIPPDRIVAGTYLMAAAATRGEIILENPPIDEMHAILEVYRKMGGQCHRIGGKLIVNGKNAGF